MSLWRRDRKSGEASITVFPKQPQSQFHPSNYPMTPHLVRQWSLDIWMLAINLWTPAVLNNCSFFFNYWETASVQCIHQLPRFHSFYGWNLTKPVTIYQAFFSTGSTKHRVNSEHANRRICASALWSALTVLASCSQSQTCLSVRFEF